MSNFILISTVFTISPGTGICDLKEGLQEDWFCLLLPMMVLKILIFITSSSASLLCQCISGELEEMLISV